MKVRITYADGTTEVIEAREAAFGLEGVFAHGPVKAATIVGREDRSPDAAFPHHNRASRSIAREAA